jgi:two-component system sensor histidine kinase KdpD
MKKPFLVRGLVLGLLGVAAVTVLFSRLLIVNASTVGSLLLAVVLGIATRSGFRVSALIALVATLCFNFFFLPPGGTVYDRGSRELGCALHVSAR